MKTMRLILYGKKCYYFKVETFDITSLVELSIFMKHTILKEFDNYWEMS